MIKMPLYRNRNRKQGKIKGTTSRETDSFDVKYESNTFVLFSQGTWSCSGWIEKHNPPPKKKEQREWGLNHQESERNLKGGWTNCHGKKVSIRDKEQRGCYHPCENSACWFGQEDRDCGGSIRLLLSLIVTGGYRDLLPFWDT